MLVKLILRYKLVFVVHIHHFVALEADEQEEEHGQRHPDSRLAGRLFEGDLVVFFVQHKQVQNQQQGDDHDEYQHE